MRILITILFLLTAITSVAEIYRSVDENGNVIFSDEPGTDSELIEVKELQTIKPPPVEPFTYTPPVKETPKYTSVAITSPQHDAAIRDNSGNVKVTVETNPGLGHEDNLVLYLDGEEIMLGKETARNFSGLNRGTHQLRAAIKGADGRIQLSSTSVTFHLLRASVN